MEKKEEKSYPVFDKNQWPHLWKKSQKYITENKFFKSKINFKNAKKYITIISGVGYKIDYSSTEITAHLFNDNQIASCSLEQTDEAIWLDQIHVDKEFQGFGIGKMLITIAADNYKSFRVAYVNEHKAYRYSLTIAGKRLIDSCIRKNILNEDHLIKENVPLDSDESDPGMVCVFRK